VLKSSNDLLSLVNHMLELARLETNTLELDLSEVDLMMLLEQSLALAEGMSITRSIRVSTDIHDLPERMIADESKLKQSIDSLLSNAVKFTPDGGSICLTAKRVTERHPHPVAGGCVEISVTDTGIGLKEEDCLRIFNPFEQVDSSTTRKFQGAGVGLALTKRVVELHGGRIWVESEGEGKGSTFTCILPVRTSGDLSVSTPLP
jgi:signal transduction histidine kinase